MGPFLRCAAAAACICVFPAASSAVSDSTITADTVARVDTAAVPPGSVGVPLYPDTAGSVDTTAHGTVDASAEDTTGAASASGDSTTTGIVTDSAFFELDFMHDGTEADAAALLEALPGAMVRHYGVHGLGGQLMVNGRFARAGDITLDGLPVLAAMPDLPDVTLLPYCHLRTVERNGGGVELVTEYDARIMPFMRVTYQASNFLPMIPVDNRWQQGGAYAAWRFLPAGAVQGYYRSVVSEAVDSDDVNFDDITTSHTGVAAEYLFAGRWLVRGHIGQTVRTHTAYTTSERVRQLKNSDLIRAGVTLADARLGIRLNQGVLTYTNQPYWKLNTTFGVNTGIRYDGNARWRHRFAARGQSLGITAGWLFGRLAGSTGALRQRTLVRGGVRYGLLAAPWLLTTAEAGMMMNEDGIGPEAGLALASPDSNGMRYRAAYALRATAPTLTEHYGYDVLNRFHTVGDSSLPTGRQHRMSVAGGWGTGTHYGEAEAFVTAADGLVEPGYRDSTVVMTAYDDVLLAGLNLSGTWHAGMYRIFGQYQVLGTAESGGVALYHRPVHAGKVVCSRSDTYKDGKVEWTLRTVFSGQGACTGYSLLKQAPATVAAFARADIATVLRIMDIRITYSLENVSNTDYRYYADFPMPGRTHRMTVDWDFWN